MPIKKGARPGIPQFFTIYMQHNISSTVRSQPKGRNIPTQIKDLLFEFPGLTRAEVARRLKTTMTVINMTVDAFVETGKINDRDGQLYLVRLDEMLINLLQQFPGMTCGAIATKLGLSHKFAKNLIESGLNQAVLEMRGELVYVMGDAPPELKIVNPAGKSTPSGQPKTAPKQNPEQQKKSAIAAQKVKDRSELVDLNLRRDSLARELDSINNRIAVLQARLKRRVEV